MRKPRFVMIMGAPLTGRHPLAEALSKQMQCEVISSKHIRREMFPGQEFSPSQDRRVFKEVNERLEMAFAENRDVIMVGMNRKGSTRKNIADYARENGFETICVYCARSLKSILKENSQRLIKRDEDEITRRFFMMSSPPPQDEGWDAVYKVNVPSASYVKLERRTPQQEEYRKCA